MTKEQIVALAVKLFAVFLFIYSFRMVSFIVPINYIEDISASAWVIAGSLVVIFICIVLLLWFFPLLIARKLMPSDEIKEGEAIASIKDLDVIAFSILGLWLLATAVPDMIYWILTWSVILSKELGDAMVTDQVISTIVTGFELIMGFWLLLGAKGLRGLLRRMRYAGS